MTKSNEPDEIESNPILKLIFQGKSYIKAQFEHWLAGRPKTPLPVRMERLLACSTCRYLDPKEFTAGACVLCGCDVYEKVTWADACCPANPPRWVVYELATNPPATNVDNKGM